jgi:hypothetical protein
MQKTLNISDLNVEAAQIARSRSVLTELDRSLRKQGFSGDATIPKLTFLTALSRNLPEPVSMVVMGASGSGKSYAVNSGLQFVPEKDIVRLSGMSDHFLAYAGEYDLQNKVIFLGEAAGMSEGNGRTFLRQLLTDGEITHSTVQKTKDGMKAEMLKTVKGPVAFIMTTTAGKIHHEDQSRMLQLNVSEDEDRTREALLNMARGKTKTTVTLDLSPWHELVETIAESDHRVQIPYGEYIAEHVPVDNPKIQRDFQKVLTLIRTCALVHMFTRDRNEEGELIATEDDYRTVYELTKSALEEGLEESVSSGVREVVEGIREMTSEKAKLEWEGVSQSALAEKIGRNRSVVSRNAFIAEKAGYLENKTPGKGREAHLVLGGRKLPNGGVLPAPEDLFTDQMADPYMRFVAQEVNA